MLQAVIGRIPKSRILRRYLGRPYMGFSRWLWRRLPASPKPSPLVCSYGRHLQNLVRLNESRRMSIGTLFLRNRPELAYLRRLVDRKENGSSLSIAVLACSKGAEVYSIAFVLRPARPDLNMRITGVDISKEVLDVAERGVYSLKSLGGMGWPNPSLIAEKGRLAWDTWQGQNVSIFERMTEEEMEAMFARNNEEARVKERFKEGITWQVGDAADPELVRRLGPQDIVMAKNFLCHMNPQEAEKCLFSIPRLVKPGGYLFVSGVDLDVRTKVALELGWKPITDMIEEIHEGDPSLTSIWPWNYCGLEPLDRSRDDWLVRYASIFQIGKPSMQEH